MQYRRLGNTGLLVSRLSFGAMTLGSGKTAIGLNLTIDQQKTNDLVARAFDAGINLFDTADGYGGGQSEVILGQALGKRRKDAILATKCGFRVGQGLTDAGLSKRHVIEACEASLERLGTDWIDLYQVHKIDPLTPFEETVRALDDLVRRGLVRYVGFSNWQAWQAATALGLQKAAGLEPFVSAQMYYSLVGRDLEHDFVPFVRHAGIGVLVWSPLASGFLSGKYSRENPKVGGRLEDFDFIPRDAERGWKIIDELKAIAAKRNAKPAQIALAWVLAKDFVTSVIMGFSNESSSRRTSPPRSSPSRPMRWRGSTLSATRASSTRVGSRRGRTRTRSSPRLSGADHHSARRASW